MFSVEKCATGKGITDAEDEAVVSTGDVAGGDLVRQRVAAGGGGLGVQAFNDLCGTAGLIQRRVSPS